MAQLRISLLSFFIFLLSLETLAVGPSKVQRLRPSKVDSFLQTASESDSTQTTRLQKVGVYYGNWDGYGRNFQICNVPGDKLDYLFYSFIDPSTGTCQFSDAWLDIQRPGPNDGVCGSALQSSSSPLLGNMFQLKMLKQRYPNLKVIAAIGGYSFSKAFHNYIGTATARTSLVSSCVKMLNTYNTSFDGFDIDLEYPCISTDIPCGDNITPTTDDRANFAALIQEFRKQMGSTPFLSIATSADQVKAQTGPFVGSLGAPTVGTWEPAIFDYSDIKINYQTSTNRFFDSTSQATYILDATKGLYITYDDPQSIQAKTAFVRSKGYQGVFAWELASDTKDFQLVQAMGQ